jgi:hypothetical protein
MSRLWTWFSQPFRNNCIDSDSDDQSIAELEKLFRILVASIVAGLIIGAVLFAVGELN